MKADSNNQDSVADLGIFDLNEPSDLYRIILDVYAEYIDNPTERNFLFLVFGFTHLREWIAKSSHKEIQQKKNDGKQLTDEETFFDDIYDLSSFKIIQSLCNRSKHRIVRHDRDVKTFKDAGLRAGLGKAGDRLNQLYFLIDGRDSRDFFIELIQKYNQWFSMVSDESAA